MKIATGYFSKMSFSSLFEIKKNIFAYFLQILLNKLFISDESNKDE